MLTNVVVHLYYLGVTMGAGDLPDYVMDSKSIVGLERDRNQRIMNHQTGQRENPLYEDNRCGLRCLVYHQNITSGKGGYDNMEREVDKLEQIWEKPGVNLADIEQFEGVFDIDVDIFTLCEDGAVIPRYLS